MKLTRNEKITIRKISNNHGKSLHLLTGNLKQRPHPNDPTSAPLSQPPPHLFSPQLLNPPD